MNSTKRTVEVFSAGCAICEETISLVKSLGCESCDIIVHDMRKDAVVQRALQLGVRSLPAIAIDGKLADCCSGRGPDEATLRAAGLRRADREVHPDRQSG